MLDVGCSYGIGSAFVKYGCSFDEMVAFFSSRAPRPYHAACEAMRMWLNLAPPVCDVRAVGLDSSKPAIDFAMDAGVLDGGIARDFEQSVYIRPLPRAITWAVRSPMRSFPLRVSWGYRRSCRPVR